MALPALAQGEPGFGTAGNTGVALAVVVLLIWNINMYRQAGQGDKADPPSPALKRYLTPVAATASFAVGFFLFFS